eukprot:gene13633-15057_t
MSDFTTGFFLSNSFSKSMFNISFNIDESSSMSIDSPFESTFGNSTFGFTVKCGDEETTNKHQADFEKRTTTTSLTSADFARQTLGIRASWKTFAFWQTKQRLTLIKKEKDALINSVDDSNIRIGDDMIANWEADFREKAKASLNRNSSTTIVNQLAEYFKLHEELFSVPIVDKFMDNTDKASSILTGQEELYCLLNSTKENYGRKKKRMALLERKLFCDSGYTKEEALRDGKEQLTEQTIDVLRTRLVHIYINLKQQKLEVSKLADSSKKRIKIHKQISKNTSVLESTVDKYNLVSSISSKRYSKLEKADVALGKFAWQTDAAECYVVPVWLRKQIVDKNVILKRCREELSLLVEEMGSFTSFFQERINKHQQEILEIEQGLTALNSGGENSNIIEILSTSDAQIKDYFHRNSAEQLQQSLNAMICLKRHGIYICKQRLGMAAFHFKKALGFNPVQLTIAEEENSEEPEFSDENDDDEEYDEEFDANIINSVTIFAGWCPLTEEEDKEVTKDVEVEVKKPKPQDPRKQPRGGARKIAGETVKANNESAFEIIEQSLRSLHDVPVNPKVELPKVDSKGESTKSRKEVAKDVSVKRQLPMDLEELMGCDETRNATASILDIDDDSSILNDILNIDFENEFDKKKPVSKIAHKGQPSAPKPQTTAVGKGRGKMDSFGQLIKKYALSDSSSDEE